MRRQQLVPLCCLAGLLVLGAAVVATPVAASESAPTASPSSAVDGGLNRTLNETIALSVASDGDGGQYLGGTTGFPAGNSTLTRLAPDGTTAWTRTYETANESAVVDVVTDGDRVYFLQATRGETGAASPSSTALALVGADRDGEVRWRRSLNASAYLGSRSLGLTATADGVAVAYRRPAEQGVTLAQFDADGAQRAERTYSLDAAPRSLTTTADGFLLTGVVSYDTPWVLRTDADGDPVLNRTYPGQDIHQFVGGVPTADGGAFLAGTQNPGHTDAQSVWVTRVDADGVPTWSRVYGDGSDGQLRGVLPDGDGVVLLTDTGFAGSNGPAGSLLGVGPDGNPRHRASVGALLATDAATGAGRSVTVVGVRGTPGRTARGVVRSVALPEASATDSLAVDAAPSSNGTVYRGQNLAIGRPGAAGTTLDLVAVPGEYDAFDEHVVRRIHLDENGSAVVETATLAPGEYVVRTPDGRTLSLWNGWAVDADGREDLSFRLASQDLYRVEPNRTFVDPAAGEQSVTLSLDSQRSEYAVYVTADRFRGESADAATLRRAFETDPGFVGVERVGGEPAARVDVGAGGNVTVAAGAFGPGLYDLTVRGTDTGDGGAVADTRLVVGSETERPVSLTLGSTSLRVPVGGEASTNVTVGGLTDGVGAMSMSANRTGAPAVGLSMDLDVDATHGVGSAGWSSRRAEAAAKAFDGDTPNGTVTVGSLDVSADEGYVDPGANATGTVTVRLDWVVDENGVPYTVPGETTVTVEVTNLDAASGGASGGSATASGSEHVSGHGHASASG
ncbi:MAG: hypothetical protein ABEJ23_04225 [Haloarculaceae archaeon]